MASEGFCLLYFLLLFETERQHANAEAQEAVDWLAILCQVERRCHSCESNRQLLPWDMGISPPSASSSWSSRTSQLRLLGVHVCWRLNCVHSKLYTVPSCVCCWLWNMYKGWRCNLVSLEHVSLRYLFLDPHLAMHRSIVDIWLINVTK